MNAKGYTDSLDLFVENIMDIAREYPIDDARIIIRDRVVKDAERCIRMAREGVTEDDIEETRGPIAWPV